MNATDSPAVAIEHLSFRYPKAQTLALQDLSLQIERGQMLALLGPNGGGKTTLFRILTTQLTPNVEHANSNQPMQLRVFGQDVLQHPAAVRPSLGVVFQQPSVDELLTVWENVRVQASLYGMTGQAMRQAGEHWLRQLDLYDRRHERVARLSGGLRRRLEIAKALLHNPPLLLLDEPTTGLDPAARRDFWRDLQQLRQQRDLTILLTTHLLEEAETCDRVAILAHGRLVAVDRPTALKARVGGQVIVLKLPNDVEPDMAKQLAEAIRERGEPWAEHAQPRVQGREIRFEQADATAAVAHFADIFKQQVEEIRITRPTLDDVFMHLTGRRLNESTEDRDEDVAVTSATVTSH